MCIRHRLCNRSPCLCVIPALVPCKGVVGCAQTITSLGWEQAWFSCPGHQEASGEESGLDWSPGACDSHPQGWFCTMLLRATELRAGTMPCLAIIAICEKQPAWGPWLRMPLPLPRVLHRLWMPLIFLFLVSDSSWRPDVRDGGILRQVQELVRAAL